jgi:hypothetical protein
MHGMTQHLLNPKQGDLTSMSFLFLFSVVDFWRLEKLEHIDKEAEGTRAISNPT